jgi:TolB protein
VTLLLDPVGDNEHLIHSAVSPDLTKIAYQHEVYSETFQLISAHIYVADFDPNVPSISNPVQMTFDGFNGHPTWSPDSQEIAFASVQGGPADIWVMNADGSNKRKVTDTPGISEFSPTWQNP